MFRNGIIVALITVLVSATGAQAKTGDLLFSNRFYGVVSSGLGAYFLIEANKARGDGNDAYALYEAAGSSSLARELYDESREKDTKAAVMLGLGVGTLTYGIHMLLKGDKEELPDPKMDRGLMQVKGVKVDAGADRQGRLGVLFRRTF